MTVIAWDGRTLAADKRAVQAGLARTVTKIHRVGGTLVGTSGCAHVGADLKEWLLAGADPGKFPPKARDDEATLLVIRNGRVEIYVASPFPVIVEDEQVAIGCGRDYALAAMACGKNARESVEIACRFEVNCGNGVDTLTL